jgi:DNA-binding transcriptional LysR family regulator
MTGPIGYANAACRMNLLPRCRTKQRVWGSGRTMEIRQVQYAIAVSEELSFTGAAKRCGVTQPTITNAIRQLERELGRPLFRRRPSVQLTEFGERVLREFYRVQDICDGIAGLSTVHGLALGTTADPGGAGMRPAPVQGQD